MTTERRRPKPAAYHLMSLQEKSARSLGQVRDASVRCPDCDTQLMPADLLVHLEQRCQGRPEPGAGAKWLSHREVMQLGVSRATLNWWVVNHQVRFIGERQDRKYLHRDLVVKIAQRRGFRRR